MAVTLPHGIPYLLLLLALLLSSPPAAAQQEAASYRFLVSSRDAGGILYTASAGQLRGRPLPLSFLDSAAYWGEHVCSSADCAVIDRYNPQTSALTPEKSIAGDLQTERINTHNGTNIYDAATWQIAVMLGSKKHPELLLPNQDAYGLVSNQNLLLRAGHNGDSRHLAPAETRAITVGPVFVYNQHRISEPAQAYSFRMFPRSWLSIDPLAGSPYARAITAVDLPPHNAEYQPGQVSWADWKPITGENAWAYLIGPLQAAALHHTLGHSAGFVPFHDPALQNAVAVLPAFAAMQSPLGAVYYAPAGTLANQGDQPVDPYFVAVENNISLYAGLHILRATLENTLHRDPALTAQNKDTILQTMALSQAMSDGGTLAAGRATEGVRNFLRYSAWFDGEFVQGGIADKPQSPSRWQPTREPKAVDVNTWGIAAIGPATIDSWFGFGASYANWQRLKRWGGYGEQTSLWGVGFSDLDGNGIDSASTFRQGVLSVEWTAGAITMVRAMLDHYRTVGKDAPQYQQAQQYLNTLQEDERSMLAAMDKLRVDTYSNAGFNGTPNQYSKLFAISTKPYLYASKRYLIPFGWYANPIPSTCATAWMIMVANHYNPFLPGAIPK